jgi:hypothetical protein
MPASRVRSPIRSKAGLDGTLRHEQLGSAAFRESGMDEFISKPFKVHDFQRILRMYQMRVQQQEQEDAEK